MTLIRMTALTLALAFPGGVHAQTGATKLHDANAVELAAARADLARAARRVVELSRATNPAPPGVRFERRDSRPVLGVVLAPDAQAGVRIAGVTPDSAAAQGGLRSGDRLIAIDNHRIEGASSEVRIARARELIGKLDVDRPARLQYIRGNITAQAKVTPKTADRFYAWTDRDGMSAGAGDEVSFIRKRIGSGSAGAGVDAEVFSSPLPPGIAPQIRREIIRVEPGCRGKGCDFPVLAQAFRWNGLNLASVDARLGRYFGTSSGVLVLSTGQALNELQPGDVLRKVDGKSVTSPREVMTALQAHAAGSRVAVDYLRDRKRASTRVTVPKAVPLPLPPPPPPAPAAPPPPPAPPSAMNNMEMPFAASLVLALAPPAPPSPPDAPPAPPTPPTPYDVDVGITTY